MKKGLFLLPLLAGFVCAGCEFELFGKQFQVGGNSNNTQTSGNGNGTGTGTGGGSHTGGDSGNDGGGSQTDGGNTSGGGGTVSGTPFATVTLKGLQDAGNKNARPLVFSNGGATVTIGQSNASTDMSQAIEKTKTYEFRVYKGMSMDFAANQSFSKLVIEYSTWKESSGTTYYFDMELPGATNDHDDSVGKAIVTLDAPTTSYSAGDATHQTRISSVAFYA